MNDTLLIFNREKRNKSATIQVHRNPSRGSQGLEVKARVIVGGPGHHNIALIRRNTFPTETPARTSSNQTTNQPRKRDGTSSVTPPPCSSLAPMANITHTGGIWQGNAARHSKLR